MGVLPVASQDYCTSIFSIRKYKYDLGGTSYT